MIDGRRKRTDDTADNDEMASPGHNEYFSEIRRGVGQDQNRDDLSNLGSVPKDEEFYSDVKRGSSSLDDDEDLVEGEGMPRRDFSANYDDEE